VFGNIHPENPKLVDEMEIHNRKTLALDSSRRRFVGFGFLWTHCNPTNQDGDENPCGIITHWLGIIFIFMIFFVYAIYSILKDCTCFLYGCLPCNRNRPETSSTQQVHPSNDEGVWESTAGFGLDLPSYEDALEMPKVEEPKADASGQMNPAFLNELPPEYTENDRVSYEVRQSHSFRNPLAPPAIIEDQNATTEHTE